MATIKKSNKKKIIIPICLVLVVAIIVASVVVAKANSGVESVTLSTISTDDIYETVSATGDVSSGASREYKASTIATCKEVFVKVGDEVKQGDILATFDTQNLDSQISSLQSSYDTANSSYKKAVKSQQQAEKNLASVNKKLSELEKELAEVSDETTTSATTKKVTTTVRQTTTKQTTTQKATTTVAPTTTTTTTTEKDSTTTTTTEVDTSADSTTTTKRTSLGDGDISDAEIKQMFASIGASLETISTNLNSLVETITALSNDVQTTNATTRVVMATIAEELANSNFSSDSIADAVGDAVTDAINQGLIDETQYLVESGVAVQTIEAAVRAVDWKSVGAGMAQTSDVKLASLQLQIAALTAQQEIYSLSADTTTVDAQKQVVDTTKSALDTLKASQSELQAGWVSSIDGTVTECNVVAGEQTSALETGIKIENTSSLVATISLGEYDVHKVKVGMQATITTAYGSYTGEVLSIAPTATGGSESSVLDSVGSMAGISGLSSLTSSGAGVECQVSINEPDDNIIIGFDADVEIQTGTYSGVAVVPTESIVLEKTGTYVYLYNEEESTVTKTQITTGAISSTAYQITDGISVGDKIIANPASDYEEDTFKVKVVNKK